MADGGEQRGPDPVPLGVPPGRLRLVHEALAVEYDGGVRGRRSQNAEVGAARRPESELAGEVVADVEVAVGG
ncbi:hypothetical protein ACLQ2G_34115, partial [Streptomyces flavovirens]